MASAGIAASAADALLQRKEELARAITDELYAVMPELLPRHGERGRVKCLEDMRYNLEHLAPAVALEDDSLFVRYVTWLCDMLAARGVGTDEVRRSLELTRDVVQARMRPGEAAAATSPVSAALAMLGDRPAGGSRNG